MRLIVSDLDGTLLRNDGAISSRTCDAIRAVERAGFVFAFVTARPPRCILSLADLVGLTGKVVCSYGAILYDLGRRSTLHRSLLASEIACELVKALRAAIPSVAFAAERGDIVVYDSCFPVLREEFSPRATELEAFLHDGVFKLLVHHPERDVELLTKLVTETVGDLGEVIHSGSGKFIEIAARGVSKGAGLKRLCNNLCIDRSAVIAFGDMPNDLPMLRFGGLGVAVANAHPTVLAIAHEITASNEEDGVAQTIEAVLDQVL